MSIFTDFMEQLRPNKVEFFIIQFKKNIMPLKKVTYFTFFSMRKNQTGALKYNLLAISLIAVSLVTLIWLVMPASFSTDLSLIGQGKPAVAIIYDVDDGRSQKLMESFNQIRQTYEDQVEFLVVDLGAPQGRQFAQVHATTSAGAHFFSSEGKKLLVVEGTHDIDALKKALNQAYGI